MKRELGSLLGLGAIVVGVAAANLRRHPTDEAVDWRITKVPVREVNLEAPARGSIVQTIIAEGVAEPVEEAQISSQLAGRVVAVLVKDGDVVKKGDLLVKLDEEDARAKLDSADARCSRLREAIAQAEADLRKAERDVSQAGHLADRGFATRTELADAKTLVSKFTAALRMSRMELAESEALRRTSLRELERTELRTPLDGVVSGSDVEVGEVVIAGTTSLPGTVLMNVNNLSGVRVRADVDESDIPLVRRGQSAQVYLQADQRTPISGMVDRVAAQGTKSGDVVTYDTRIDVDKNATALRAGMTATVEIEVRRVDNVLAVPVQAVVHRQRKDLPVTAAVRAWCERNARSPGERARDSRTRYVKVVFILERGIALARPVETGLSDERQVEIISGLEPGDRVVIGPFRTLDELRDKQPVREISISED